MKVIVCGGDGFCGWATALRLSAAGHEVLIVDNLSRRKIDTDMGSNSLTPIASVDERRAAANKASMPLDFKALDLAGEPLAFRYLLKEWKPQAIVHFAEQRAAPYSMLGDVERRYTMDNNQQATHNICSAVVDVDPSIHLVHLGTMGVYGYSKDFGEIPEGYLGVTINSTGANTEILYPANPGSIYHLTKCVDQLIFQFYCKNWGLKVTDLHQGIVWGTQTSETLMDPALTNRFDYDGIYGTVLNRFLVQAARGLPLSVYGSGGQTRAFIHISDTAECVRLALENPADCSNRVRIFNQVSETRSVLELAKIVSRLTGCEISHLENPRKELAENELEVRNEGLVSLGFNPITLSDGLLEEIHGLAEAVRDSVKLDKINNSPSW